MSTRWIATLLCVLTGPVAAPVGAGPEPDTDTMLPAPDLVIAVLVDGRILEVRRFGQVRVRDMVDMNIPSPVTAWTVPPSEMTEMTIERFDPTKLVARRIDGRLVSFEALMQELAKPTPVILASQARKPNALFAKIFRPESLVLQLPPPTCESISPIPVQTPPPRADRRPDSLRCKTIEELFAAYKKATEEKDWQTLFLLGTRELQDGQILEIALYAAAANDDEPFRRLVEKYGVNWKPFDHPWTEAENQRYAGKWPAVAASLSKQVTKKQELFVAARSYIEKSDPLPTKVHELKNLVRDGATAEGQSFESWTTYVRSYDAQGKLTGKFPQIFSSEKPLLFRQTDGYWYLARAYETAPATPPPPPPSVAPSCTSPSDSPPPIRVP